MQLTIDGREIAMPTVTAAAAAPLTGAQREILIWLRDKRSIRSLDAGVIVHAHRTHPCPEPKRGEACCKWASSDGGDALKRLLERGLVKRIGAGVWMAIVGRAL